MFSKSYFDSNIVAYLKPLKHSFGCSVGKISW
jgi:hypothetical protein